MVVFPRMRTLYFDCFSGISGDMTIGALLDLGLDLEYLRSELLKLPLNGYRIKSSRVIRANLSAMKFDVELMAIPGIHRTSTPTPIRTVAHIERHRKFYRMIRSSALNANSKRIARQYSRSWQYLKAMSIMFRRRMWSFMKWERWTQLSIRLERPSDSMPWVLSNLSVRQLMLAAVLSTASMASILCRCLRQRICCEAPRSTRSTSQRNL